MIKKELIFIGGKITSTVYTKFYLEVTKDKETFFLKIHVHRSSEFYQRELLRTPALKLKG